MITVSLIVLLILAAVIVVGYHCRSLFGFFHYQSMFHSTMQRIEQSTPRDDAKPKCPRCNGDVEEGHVMIQYWTGKQDVSLLIQGFNPYQLSMGAAESMLTGARSSHMSASRRAYRCPTCGIIGVDVAS
jgi:hypothetical protein